MDVGAHEVKWNLSEHLRRVAGGEVIRITDRGVPVATLSPITAGDPLQRGVDEGWIRPPSRTGLIGEHERCPALARVLDVLREDRDS